MNVAHCEGVNKNLEENASNSKVLALTAADEKSGEVGTAGSEKQRFFCCSFETPDYNRHSKSIEAIGCCELGRRTP
jgi:hypothetical protein